MIRSADKPADGRGGYGIARLGATAGEGGAGAMHRFAGLPKEALGTILEAETGDPCGA